LRHEKQALDARAAHPSLVVAGTRDQMNTGNDSEALFAVGAAGVLGTLAGVVLNEFLA